MFGWSIFFVYQQTAFHQINIIMCVRVCASSIFLYNTYDKLIQSICQKKWQNLFHIKMSSLYMENVQQKKSFAQILQFFVAVFCILSVCVFSLFIMAIEWAKLYDFERDSLLFIRARCTQFCCRITSNIWCSRLIVVVAFFIYQNLSFLFIIISTLPIPPQHSHTYRNQLIIQHKCQTKCPFSS